MRLAEIALEDYVREVLPLTAPLWAGSRDLATYVAHWEAIARCGYGKRHYRTAGLYDGRALLASFKRYERTMHHGTRRLSAIGIGAIFTPAERRGRGYASVMLGMALDKARADGCDVAYLYSDIGTQFYALLGFRALGSREFVLRADSLPSKRLALEALEERDWSGVRRCYELCERHHPAGFTRTPLVWDWIRLLRNQRVAGGSPQPTDLVVRHGRGVGAYVLGARDPQRDAYVLAEYGFADHNAASLIPALLRAAAGDLRRVIGWLPPAGAREVLPKVSTRKRRTAILMMAPLTERGRDLIGALEQARHGDACWTAEHV